MTGTGAKLALRNLFFREEATIEAKLSGVPSFRYSHFHNGRPSSCRLSSQAASASVASSSMSPSRRLPLLTCIRSFSDSPSDLEPIRYGLIVNCEDLCKGNVSTARIPLPTSSTCIRQQSPTASAVQRFL